MFMSGVKRYLFLFMPLMLAFLSCDEPVVSKPKNLVSRDKMINILTDIHLAEAIYQTRRFSSDRIMRLTDTDFYYSVLKKHNVPDSTFEMSLIYYTSTPKEYEKIYSRVLNRLNEMEQKFENKELQPIDIGSDTQ